MQALAEAASLNIGRLTDESAVFLVPFRGAVYHVAVVLRRDKPQAVMHAFSNAAFPLGHVPLAVRQAMANMNGETMECDYGVLDGETRRTAAQPHAADSAASRRTRSSRCSAELCRGSRCERRPGPARLRLLTAARLP